MSLSALIIDSVHLLLRSMLHWWLKCLSNYVWYFIASTRVYFLNLWPRGLHWFLIDNLLRITHNESDLSHLSFECFYIISSIKNLADNLRLKWFSLYAKRCLCYSFLVSEDLLKLFPTLPFKKKKRSLGIALNPGSPTKHVHNEILLCMDPSTTNK